MSGSSSRNRGSRLDLAGVGGVAADEEGVDHLEPGPREDRACLLLALAPGQELLGALAPLGPRPRGHARRAGQRVAQGTGPALGERALADEGATLAHPWGQTGVGHHLVDPTEAGDIAPFGADRRRVERADPVVAQRGGDSLLEVGKVALAFEHVAGEGGDHRAARVHRPGAGGRALGKRLELFGLRLAPAPTALRRAERRRRGPGRSVGTEEGQDRRGGQVGVLGEVTGQRREDDGQFVEESRASRGAPLDGVAAGAGQRAHRSGPDGPDLPPRRRSGGG